MSETRIRFKVRNRGGNLAGKTLESEVPAFDWALFKNLPNAEAFVKKAYFAAAQKVVREIHEGKNATSDHHLQSMESLVARSLKFTRDEIAEWCETRNWDMVRFIGEPTKGISFLSENLPVLSSDEGRFPEHLRSRAAEIVASVADSSSDPVADYLFVKLSQEQRDDDDLLSLI